MCRNDSIDLFLFPHVEIAVDRARKTRRLLIDRFAIGIGEMPDAKQRLRVHFAERTLLGLQGIAQQRPETNVFDATTDQSITEKTNVEDPIGMSGDTG